MVHGNTVGVLRSFHDVDGSLCVYVGIHLSGWLRVFVGSIVRCEGDSPP